MEPLYFLLPIIGGILLYAFMNAGVRAPGVELSKKFVSLGNLKGKSLSEIVSVCGQPPSVTNTSNGSIRQWMATGYHIVLLFDKNNICLGINSETKV